MLKKFAVQPLVAQMVAVATIALRTAKQPAATADAAAKAALMSVASEPVIVSLWQEPGSRVPLYMRSQK